MSEPNAVCKSCGKDYYVCDYCTRTNNYKTITCSPECYDTYITMVLEQRKKEHDKFKQEYVNIYTSRHDLTEEQYKELMSKPIEQVIEETKIELKEYINKYQGLSIVSIVSIINKEIENKNKLVEDKVKQQEPVTLITTTKKKKRNAKR